MRIDNSVGLNVPMIFIEREVEHEKNSLRSEEKKHS
jgi:hypothetical protein